MPGFTLTCTLAAVAVIAVGKYFFGGKDDDDGPIPPTSGGSYHSSSSYGGTSWSQTQQSYRPPTAPPSSSYTYRATYTHSHATSRTPPPPSTSYTHRPPATYAHSHSTSKTPAPPNYGGAYQPPVVPPSTRTAGQTTPSSTRPPASYSSLLSTANVHAHNQTRTPAPPNYGGVYQPPVAPPSTRTPRQTTPSSTRPQALNPSLFNPIHEPPEYEYFHATSHVLSRGPTNRTTVVEVISSDLHSDEISGVEDLELAKKLREQARRRGREMTEARSRAKSARKKGYQSASHVHRQEAIAHESAKTELDKRAAKIVFRENNKNRREGGKIDLHGLYVAEAVQFAKDQLQTARSRGDELVRFIVGKGLHSDAGEAKIRPALEKLFTKRGLIHSLDPKNAGVLIVRLD